jgi:hypothetical protein
VVVVQKLAGNVLVLDVVGQGLENMGHVIHLSARSLSPTRGSSLWDYFDHDNAIFVDSNTVPYISRWLRS